MIALYAIAALGALMWVGLLYVLLVEPIRLYRGTHHPPPERAAPRRIRGVTALPRP